MPETIETRGTLVFVGGDEWHTCAELFSELAGGAGGEVLVVPTAAAFERPSRAVDRATTYFSPLGARVEAAMVLTRANAEDPALATRVRASAFTYLVGGSPLHLRSVLKDSAVLRALVSSWRDGAVVAGSSGAAMALTDPMVDPRGGAFTVGLGLARDLAVVPHHRDERTSQFRRTLALAPARCALVGLCERSVLVRDRDGLWRSAGEREPEIFVDNAADSLSCLAGKPVA